MKILVATSSVEKYQEIASFLAGHNIRTWHYLLPPLPASEDLIKDVHDKAAIALEAFNEDPLIYILIESSSPASRYSSVLAVYHAKRATDLFTESLHQKARLRNLSKYILAYHTRQPEDITSSSNGSLLHNFLYHGNVAFNALPIIWYEKNDLFKQLLIHPLYRQLINYVTYKVGIFFKVWSLECQKNYWYAPLNAGLPIVKKRDPLHEGTFLLHDTFHFLFQDPVILGTESEREVQAYIAYRMMSEACTLVLADMFGVAHARLAEHSYNVAARRIYPLFLSCRANTYDIETCFRLMYANSVYCLYGDKSLYHQFGADCSDLEAFDDKYSRFFAMDYQWNDKNIHAVISTTQNNYRLNAYSEFLSSNLKPITSAQIVDRITLPDGRLSFDRLFLLFWKHFEAMLSFEGDLSHQSYLQAALPRYLYGQMRLPFLYPEASVTSLWGAFHNLLKTLIKGAAVSDILNAYALFSDEFNVSIDTLVSEGALLPHEGIANKLHVPHFPPYYGSYDKPRDMYPSLQSLHRQIFNGSLVRENSLEHVLEQAISQQVKEKYRALLQV